MNSLQPALGVEVQPLVNPQDIMNDTPGVFAHLRGVVGTVAERVSDVMPTLPMGVTARVAAGSLALISSAAVAPTVAEGKILVGQGIAGVKLGDTEAEVTQTLGAPTLQQAPDVKGSVEWNYAKRPLLGAMSFDTAGSLTGLWTSSRQQKTNKNVGPGSSVAQVRKAYPKTAKCAPGVLGPLSVECIMKSRYDGRPVVTVFAFLNKHLGAREVDVDFVQ
jgi:hypothetical protein